MENKRLSALDLFSGAGGFSLGMEMAGIDVVAAVEYDEKIAKTYEYNHRDTYMINDDIRNVPATNSDRSLGKAKQDSIKSIFMNKNKEVDIIFGGPPCQGFSMSGYRNRNKKPFLKDERNYLYLEYIRMVEELNPKVFVIENVPGILTFEDGKIRNEIEEEFEKLGYNVHAEIVSSQDFGIPQKRKRALFIGNRLGAESKEFMPNNISLKSNKVCVWDALSDLPVLESGEGSEPISYASKPKTSYQEYLRKNATNKVYNHISSKHKKSTINILRKIKPGQTMKDLPEELRTKSVHSGAYGRMDPNLPAYTITTRINTPSVGRITHPYSDRTITPREAARLQSFPDDYRFIGDITTVGMQIGNAVPPLLGKVIGESVKSIFKESLQPN